MIGILETPRTGDGSGNDVIDSGDGGDVNFGDSLEGAGSGVTY